MILETQFPEVGVDVGTDRAIREEHRGRCATGAERLNRGPDAGQIPSLGYQGEIAERMRFAGHNAQKSDLVDDGGAGREESKCGLEMALGEESDPVSDGCQCGKRIRLVQ